VSKQGPVRPGLPGLAFIGSRASSIGERLPGWELAELVDAVRHTWPSAPKAEGQVVQIGPSPKVRGEHVVSFLTVVCCVKTDGG
jgi:hypothetical protein